MASEIALLHRRGVAYKEMAILFRINAQSEAFEEALGEHGIPYVMRGVEGFFRRAEVRQAVTLLRGAARGGEGGGELVDEVRAIFAAWATPTSRRRAPVPSGIAGSPCTRSCRWPPSWSSPTRLPISPPWSPTSTAAPSRRTLRRPTA